MERRKFLFTAGQALILAGVAGCGKLLPTGPEESPTADPVWPDRFEPHQVVGPAWEGNIVSEAKYSLCQQRTGTSHKVYQGLAMGDWDYPHQGDCCNALARVRAHIGADNVGSLGLWQNQYRQGGYCKFFTDFVLYRSSYGYPGGHLVLRGGTYSYPNPRSVSQAQPGWILQKPSPGPHTAIVVALLGWGLDVIDSNFTGGNGSFAISRHPLSWSQLTGYNAYRAHEACVLIN